jgi:hypothetical protein
MNQRLAKLTDKVKLFKEKKYMKMKIIGAIERHGVSKKTGRPYDLTIATAIHPDLRPGAFGSKVEEITLNANTYPAESIKINSTYMVDCKC